MLEYLKDEFNQGQTANGAFAYKSTQSAVLDLFAMGGAYRERSDNAIRTLFSKAYAENQLYALRVLFYLRDIRGGQGERRFFRVAIEHLANHHPEALRKNLHLIPEYARWDDMWVLLETPLKDDVVKLVKSQLFYDLSVEHPSLLAKWLPSENASSYKTKKYAKILREGLGLTPRQYRKTLSKLREQINIVERKMSANDWHTIDYSKLPSRAGLIYRQAFLRHDEEGYKKYLEGLQNGIQKINAQTLYPYDVVLPILEKTYAYRYRDQITPEEIKLLEAQWNALPNYIGEKKEDSLVMCDCSGSMYFKPLSIAISLAMYIAERNKGAFHNYFMTFSSRPNLVKITGGNIVEKVMNIAKHNFIESTNIEKALKVILDTAVKNNLPKDQMVKKLYIVSDMQFDMATEGASVHIFKRMKQKFEEAGYDFPHIVFWNVNAFETNTQFTMNDVGVQLVSGSSPSVLRYLLETDSKTPYELMLEVINSERYSAITV